MRMHTENIHALFDTFVFDRFSFRSQKQRRRNTEHRFTNCILADVSASHTSAFVLVVVVGCVLVDNVSELWCMRAYTCCSFHRFSSCCCSHIAAEDGALGVDTQMTSLVRPRVCLPRTLHARTHSAPPLHFTPHRKRAHRHTRHTRTYSITLYSLFCYIISLSLALSPSRIAC